ncbi:50S ribosomal protein L10 [Rickettsiales endosymbiont of Paramecium tredecaurelia]|uniref:50S ribosomal protein L10 n=1 Tax=Candidatus Sarmatiella mevalonica TaxID=2770581 RepID=UPI001922BDE0|nr:50S ribosomal protein L10 [Candidatus Sarmatiella mevalonica]MBL3284830.1 50S ribosomal protein L10 [Candidatus Sarmatiella mevalonica]
MTRAYNTKKTQFVNQLSRVYGEFDSMIVSHYHGLSVAQITELRNALRSVDAGLMVMKNSLAKVALRQSALSDVPDSRQMESWFKGPTVIAYGKDPIALSKVVMSFAKSYPSLKPLSAMLERGVVDVSMASSLARFSSLDQLRASLIGLLQTPAAMHNALLLAYAKKS